MNQSARYINRPPDIPFFVYHRYPVTSVAGLIEWAQKEYNDGLRMFAKRGHFDEVRRLSREYSPMRLVAEMPDFRRVVAMLAQDQKTWNQLSGRDRVFIRRAWEIYNLLRKSV